MNPKLEASLIMIPSAYKEDKVYSIIPQDRSGDLTFTRASDGTRVNSDGYVERVPWNLLQYSEQFDNAAWIKTNTTISANSTTSPDGTTNADKLIASITTSNHWIERSGYTGFNIGIHTLSIYAKSNGSNFVQIATSSGFSPTYQNFNLSNGTKGNGDASTAGYSTNIEAVGADGWYRIIFTAANASTDVRFLIVPILSDVATRNPVFAGNGTDGVYIWGAQLNEGSTAKPYFPTTDRLNVPRLDYSNGCPSLLLDPQRTNLVTYSEQFDNAAWNQNTATITANTTVSPDGTQNADTATNVTGTQIGQSQGGGVIGQSYTFSVWIKRLSGSGAIQIRDINNTAATISVTSEWQRFQITGTASSTTLRAYFNITTIGDSIAIWGAQLEAGSYPTSYIPTTSATVTRVADAAYKTGISSLIGQSEGVVFLDINHRYMTSYPNEYLVNLKDGTNQLWLRKESGGSNLTARLIVAGTNIWTISVNAIDGRNKIALVYKSTDSVVYLNGSQVSTSSASYSGLSLADFYFNAVGTANPETHINQAVLFPTRLTNAELAALTTL